jgi:hypothetical protein
LHINTKINTKMADIPSVGTNSFGNYDI